MDERPSTIRTVRHGGRHQSTQKVGNQRVRQPRCRRRSPVQSLCCASPRAGPYGRDADRCPNAVSNNIVPRAIINPLVTPPQRTRGPTGGTAAVGVSKSPPERAVGSRRSGADPPRGVRASRLYWGHCCLPSYGSFCCKRLMYCLRVHRPWPVGGVSARAHNPRVLVLSPKVADGLDPLCHVLPPQVLRPPQSRCADSPCRRSTGTLLYDTWQQLRHRSVSVLEDTEQKSHSTQLSGRSLTAHYNPPDVGMGTLRNQSRGGTRPPSTSTHTPGMGSIRSF